MRTILIVLALASTADAQLFRRFRQPRRVVRVEQPDVVVVQEAQPVLPVQLAFVLDQRQPSAYGAVDYTPAGIRAQRDQALLDLRQKISELTQLTTQLAQRVSAAHVNIRVPPPPPQAPIESASVVQKNCAKCHNGENADGGLTIAELRNPHINRLATMLIRQGKMPKNADGEPVDLPQGERERLALAVESLEK